MKRFLISYSIVASLCLFCLILVTLYQMNEINDLNTNKDNTIKYITDYKLRQDKKCDELTKEEIELIKIIKGEDKNDRGINNQK